MYLPVPETTLLWHYRALNTAGPEKDLVLASQDNNGHSEKALE